MRTLSRTGVLAIVIAGAGCAASLVAPKGMVQAYPAVSDDQIRAAIALPASEVRSVAVHRGLWGNFDGDERRDLAVLVEVVDKMDAATDRATGRAAKLFILEATDGALGAIAEARCGYWRGERIVAEREKRAGPTLEAVDVEGDGVDEILCRYDECGAETGASSVHARIYRCTGEGLLTLWDEVVHVRDDGSRPEAPRRYRSALTFSRGSDGALRIFVSSSCEEQGRDSGPVRIECRHKIFRWNGHAFVADRNDLVYSKHISPDVKLSMEDAP